MNATAARQAAKDIANFLASTTPATDLEREALAGLQSNPEAALDRATAALTKKQAVEGTPQPHPLLSQLPALDGYVVQIIPVGPGVVIVEATPDSDFGAYEVTGYRPLFAAELEAARAEFPQENDLPTVGYVTARTLQGIEGVDAAIVDAAEALMDRLPGCELCGALADASGYRIPQHDPRCPTHDPNF